MRLNRQVIGSIDGNEIFLDVDGVECVAVPVMGTHNFGECLLFLSDYLYLSSERIYPPFYIVNNNGKSSVCYQRVVTKLPSSNAFRPATQRLDRFLLNCKDTATVYFKNGDISDLRRSNMVYTHKGKATMETVYVVVSDFD